MTIDQMRQYIAVVKHMSFTKAAEELFVHQSTISKSIAKLEQSYGLQFLVRDRSRLVLTSAGQYFYDICRAIVAQFDVMESHLATMARGDTGAVSFMTIDTYFLHMVRQFNHFRRACPQALIQLENCSYDQIEGVYDLVYSGDYDIGMSFSTYSTLPYTGMEFMPICKDHFCLIHSRNKKFSREGIIDIRELKEQTFLMGDQTPVSIVEKLESVAGRPFEKLSVLPSHSPDSLLIQLVDSDCVSIAPRSIAEQSGPDIAITEIEGVDLSFDILIFWMKNNLNSTLKLFLNFIAEQTEELQ